MESPKKDSLGRTSRPTVVTDLLRGKEGRAKMSPLPYSKEKHNQTLLKMAIEKEANSPSSKGLAGQISNLNSIRNSFMKTSISQVLRKQLSPEGKLQPSSESAKPPAKSDSCAGKEAVMSKEVMPDVAATTSEGRETAMTPRVNKARKSLPSSSRKEDQTSLLKSSLTQQSLVKIDLPSSKEESQKKRRRKRGFRGATYNLYLSRNKRKKKSNENRDDGSVGGTETTGTGSHIDSDDSYLSEGMNTASERSYQDDDVSSEHSFASLSTSRNSGSQKTKTTSPETNASVTFPSITSGKIDNSNLKEKETQARETRQVLSELPGDDSKLAENVENDTVYCESDKQSDMNSVPVRKSRSPESDIDILSHMSDPTVNDVPEDMDSSGIIVSEKSSHNSSIASSVKSRQRIKRKVMEDHFDIGTLGIAVPAPSPTNSSEPPGVPRKMRRMFRTTADIPYPPADGVNFINRIEVVYDPKIDSVSICSCMTNPVEGQFADPNALCQALESFDGRFLGCCRSALNNQMVRPSPNIPFMAMCDLHTWRLRNHSCCPLCGSFCTQGDFLYHIAEFNQKRQMHLFHKKCPRRHNATIPAFCPHCGETKNIKSTRVEFEPGFTPSFFLTQKPIIRGPRARITFSGRSEPKEDQLPFVSYKLSNSDKVLSSDKIPAGPDRRNLERILSSLKTEKICPAKYSIKTLYNASKSGDVEKVLYIIATGLDINQRLEEYEDEMALHAAAAGGSLTVVHLLLQAGATLDALNSKMYSPLMVAIENSNVPAAQYLVKAGADLNIKGDDGMTSLHLAAQVGSPELCALILNTGRINIDIQDDGGWTPLVWASENKCVDVVKLLLGRGADPNVRDSEENTALHWAAFSGNGEITQLYLDMGCDINALNEHGDTPLHIAARQDHYECVILLLARGANAEITNKAGDIPLQCCRENRSSTYLTLSINIELKRLLKNKLSRSEKILHKDISHGKELNVIQGVNGIDDEAVPTDYLYLIENCVTMNVHIDKSITSLQGCKCQDNCTSSTCNCATFSFRCWYDKDGRLLPEFNLLDPPMIFECNRACLCWRNCQNRVLQNGITCRLQLYRTKHKGWGVRTLQDIPKGTFICEYIGEIISDSEADQREDDSYLFDLDNRDGETFCLDARHYGNVSRFINHLCEPNLVPVKVFVDHQDLSFPRIAFFSSKDIKAYEELGFDYGEKFWVIKHKSFTCGCDSPKCKYSKDTIEETLKTYNSRNTDEQEVEEVENPALTT